jgi:uncharacterized protein YkwD
MIFYSQNKIIERIKYISIKGFIALWGFIFIYGCSKDEVVPVNNLTAQMLEAINKLRREGCQCGTQYMPPVHELISNDTLGLSAKKYVIEMHDNNFLDHISPTGTSPILRAAEAGYTGQYVGENIARGYYTLEQVINAWKNSEEHCTTMMDSLYYELGAAQASDYWIQEFGRPLKIK